MFRKTLGTALVATAGLAVPGIRETETAREISPAVRVIPIAVTVPLTREVLWNPDLEKQSPFGFIPTQWNVRPQLLPGHWDVRTILATGDARAEWTARRAAR